MKSYKVKASYFKIAVKSPILILASCILMIAVLYLLAKNLEFYDYTIQKVECRSESIYTKFNSDIYQADEILFYEDKEKFVHKWKVDEIQKEGDRMILKITNTTGSTKLSNDTKGYIEIPAKRISLIEKIISK